MHRTALLFGAIVFILMGAASYFAGTTAVDYLEEQTESQILEAMEAAGQDWAGIRADGLRVELVGLAPDEGSRFKALEIIGKLIETSRLVDNAQILETTNIAPPRFTLEVLRNEADVSLIGLIPTRQGRSEILETVTSLTANTHVTDMLEMADHPVSADWLRALDFGLGMLKKLPRSKISIAEDLIQVTAVTESVAERKRIEQILSSTKPEGIRLSMDISAPRPVISPFTFRLSLSEGRVDLASCSADTKATREKILSSVGKLNPEGKLACNIGLGVPTTDWAMAIDQAVMALGELGGGDLTITDVDISLVAHEEATQDVFDRVIAKLDRNLPDLFSLHSVLPPKVLDGSTGEAVEEPDFIATKSPEGFVQLRGRVPSEKTKTAIETVALALFGNDNVYIATRIDQNLPAGWPRRVLGGLEALSKLHHGSLTVTADNLEVRGIGERPDIPSQVNRVLAVRMGGRSPYSIDVEFDEALYVVDDVPTPKECELGIATLLQRDQIVFAPASTRIEEDSLRVVSEIADILRRCPDAKFEIEGHTDSQGSDELNLAISQKRAEAVLTALLNQRVLTSGLSAVGYGPSKPIADNDTEEGRAANRRIAFRLVGQASDAEPTEEPVAAAEPEAVQEESLE